MHHPPIKKKEHTSRTWEDAPTEKDIGNWYTSAFSAAVEKLKEEHGNADTVMRLGEALGRGLYSQRLQEKLPEYTLKEWIEEIQNDVFKPLGTEFTFTKISPDIVTTFLNRNPRAYSSQDRSIAALFNFGVMRGLFLSAFPKGELLINETKTINHPEFIFKAYASAKDKYERERSIRSLTFLKKDNGT